ncbi:phage head closure protein [Terricaulis sp.]|uniref:phage head closure protein n=1 Tax=Terricaulis sp. TaxID=2768686 RepID=UPI00378427E8
MKDVIGAMRARVGLQSPTRVEDELGGASIAWVNEGEAWAQVEVDGVSQAAAFDAAPSTASYRLIINRHDAVRAGWRVLWRARVLRVTGVRDDGGAHMALLCEEEIL